MRPLLGRRGEGQPPRRRRKIVYSLLGVLAFVGLVPLASFAFKLIETSRSALVTSQQEIELQLASSIAGQLDTYVEGLTRQISTLADSFGAAILDQGAVGFGAGLEKRGTLSGLLDDQLLALRFAPLDGRAHQALA